MLVWIIMQMFDLAKASTSITLDIVNITNFLATHDGHMILHGIMLKYWLWFSFCMGVQKKKHKSIL